MRTDDKLAPVHKRQRQWDAFFKRLAPSSTTIRQLMEIGFFGRVNGALKITERFNADLASRNVNAAQHVPGRFKELRADGIFSVVEANTLLSVEHQSTHNPGMRLRFAMYREAFIEENGKHTSSAWRHVLVYSGADAEEAYKRKHLKIEHGYIDYLVIDINSVGWRRWSQGNLHDQVMGLCRRSETSLVRFKSVLDRVDESTSLDADLAAMLRTAVVLASANKRGLWAKVLAMVDVDGLLQDEMDQLLTEYQRKVVERERQRTDEAVASARANAIKLDRSRLIRVIQRDGDLEVIPLVEAMGSEEFAARSANLWDEILSGRARALVEELGAKSNSPRG